MSKTKWLGFLKLIVPIVLPMINPKLAKVTPFVVHGMEVAEQLPGKTGPEKLAITNELVNTGIVGMNTAAGKEIVDPVEVNAALNQAVSTAVAIVNLATKNAEDK